MAFLRTEAFSGKQHLGVGSLLGMGEKKKMKKLPVTLCCFMESRARSPKEMGREELCHEPLGDRSLHLSPQVALQGVLAWKWPEIHLSWALPAVSGIPAACLEQAEPQEPQSCRGTGWDTLEPLALCCLCRAGDRESGSCLSVRPSPLQPRLSQPHLSRAFPPLSLFSSPGTPEQGQYRRIQC